MPDAASKTHGGASPTRTTAPAAAGEALPDLTGRTLGDYQILRRLGMGGMGQVYLARQLSLKRDVALKLLRDDLNSNPTALLRFQAEAEAVAKLNHPNIVHIHQMGESDGLRYMALEYVEGRNLREHLARKGPPDLPVTLSIIRQVVHALQQAHEHGIVHRDIKPENILVTRKVEVKVTDFGLSRFFTGETPALNITQSGMTLGTPLYMSPEQVQGFPVDHRSDVYSFGVTCYHLLAGEPPFRGATAFDVALKHVQEQPRPLGDLCPDLPADLCAMVHKMMAKNPDDRYQSAREILRDLARLRDGLAINLAPTAGPRGSDAPLALSGPVPTTSSKSGVNRHRPPPEAPRKRVWVPWAVGLVFCVLAAAGGVLLAARNRQSDQTRTTTPPTSGPGTIGLPDVRPPEKPTITRERELLALTTSQTARPEEIVNASIELGLLYVRERRLDEANATFKKLETEPLPRAGLAGRLGRAVVLAYRDQTVTAEESNAIFAKVLSDPHPKADKKISSPYQIVLAFLVKHVELGQAVSEALNRNAAILGKQKLEPIQLELLRYPPRTGK